MNGGLSLGDESFYLDATSPVYKSTFKNVMTSILKLLRASSVDDVVDDVFRFEKQLAKVNVTYFFICDVF